MKYLFVLFFVNIIFHSYAQRGNSCPEDLVPKYGKNRQWGYANLLDQWVIEPSYTKVSPYINNKAIVQKGTLLGVIDCDGNVIIPPKYDKISNFRYGKAWVMHNGAWGLMNERGGFIVEPAFDEIQPIPMSELSWVRKGALWGLFNEEKNNFICRPQYKTAQYISENSSLVQVNEKFGFLNHVNCNYLVAAELSSVKKLGLNTFAVRKEDKWALVDQIGKVLQPFEFESVELKDPELVQMAKKGLYGLYTLKGTEIFPAKYEEIGEVSEGLMQIKEKGKYGYATRQGKIFIQPQYEAGAPFQLKQTIVRKDGKYGVINFKNQYVIHPEFSVMKRHQSGKFYFAGDSNKLYIYNLEGKKVNNEAFEKIYPSDSASFVRSVKQGKTYFFNVEKNSYAIDDSFDEATAFSHGFSVVRKTDKYGVINENGKLIVPIQYDTVSLEFFIQKPVFRLKKDGKTGIAENTGQIVVPVEYEMIAPALPNYIKAKKDGKYGIIRTNGNEVTTFDYDYLSNKIENPNMPEWPCLAIKRSKFGLINEKGEELVAIKAIDMKYIGENLYAIQAKKLYSVIDAKGNKVSTNDFDEIKSFSNGYAAVRKGNKWGVLNAKGHLKVPLSEADAGSALNKVPSSQ